MGDALATPRVNAATIAGGPGNVRQAVNGTSGEETVGERAMRGRAALAVVVALTLGLAAGAVRVAGSDTRGTPDYQWSWRLAAGKAIEIEGVNGEIQALGTTGDKVEVTARKHARHSDPSRVTVEVLEHADGITLCVRYPDAWGSHNECEPHGRSHMNTRNNDTQGDFEVRVPAGVRFVGRMVNGSVEGRDLVADAEAHTVNGSVVLETRGRAEANTVNGSVRARLGRLGPDGAVEFTTVNGGITLEIPGTLDADLSARTVNGGIETDFPITVQGSFLGRHRLSGTIGRGGPRIELSTVNGSIHLRKAGGA